MKNSKLPPCPASGDLNEWVAWRDQLRTRNALDTEIAEADCRIEELGRIKADRLRNWVFSPPREARVRKRGSGPKLVLRAEPDLFDVSAWRQRLKELERDDPSDYRDFLNIRKVISRSSKASRTLPPKRRKIDRRGVIRPGVWECTRKSDAPFFERAQGFLNTIER
ncbi:MAG: hypothetical protein ACK5LJ_07715 [Paracoccus sp. (in: a-proteobacteria)]